MTSLIVTDIYMLSLSSTTKLGNVFWYSKASLYTLATTYSHSNQSKKQIGDASRIFRSVQSLTQGCRPLPHWQLAPSFSSWKPERASPVDYNACIGEVHMLDGEMIDMIGAHPLRLNPNHIRIYDAS